MVDCSASLCRKLWVFMIYYQLTAIKKFIEQYII